MRIIAGEFGGRQIEAPEGEGTRPMLDRVREALFSTLGERLEGARVLDLFAGTGSLGLEALSRGSRHARLVERDGRAAKLLSRNVANLGVQDRARVVVADALAPSAWRDLAPRKSEAGETPLAAERYEVVFFDPPYPMVRDGPARKRVFETLTRLTEGQLSPGGVIVFHAPRGLLSRTEFGTADAEERAYGTSALWYLRAGTAQEEAQP
ncbi:MAG: 16S rRNA (guanine(966)-N(2))-methyltransferase RsmD [Planctomycetes bacterium]|nr:16S rRNA (guanine(966)-N(2))-methyltransferase RsmD [Planctomycetota bacterium]